MKWIVLCWIVFFSLAGVHRIRHFRWNEPGARHPDFRLGFLLHCAALAIPFVFRDPVREHLVPWAIGIAFASTVLGYLSMRELGRHFRFAAVVTQDHELITSGPYSFRRHPIYLGLFGLILAVILATTNWIASAISIGLYVAGSEIRTRAEDRLLAERFPAAFPAYRKRVRAWLW